MSRPALASADDVLAWCADHPHWEVRDSHLVRTSDVPYDVGCALAAASVSVAESLDHHPVLTVGYRELRVELWTHDRGGVTALDFAFATFVDDFLATHA